MASGPGGQRKSRPPSRWMCRWKTVCPGTAAVINDRTITRCEAALRGELGGNTQGAAENGGIFGSRVVERGGVLSGADQDMRGRLRRDVFKGEKIRVFVDDFRGNFLAADFAEKLQSVT